MNKATLAVVAALIFILGGVFAAIFWARGYRIDVFKKSLATTGIMVATSDPDGAAVWINGKLTTATNNTINLAPGKYHIKFTKDGFSTWEKVIEIKKEEVFKTNAFLFPALADLRPLTLTGAINPTISPDGTKIVFGVASSSASFKGDGNGIWIIDMGRAFPPTPIFAATDFRQIFRNTTYTFLSDAKFFWSVDNKQLIAYYGDLEKPTAAYLLFSEQLNLNPDIITDQVETLRQDWQDLALARSNAQIAKLPMILSSILATSAGKLSFSPDETKILYTATAAAQLLPIRQTYLPGTNPTTQTRKLEPGKTYVYDSKEDRNYLIENCKFQIGNCRWFPSSKHLLSTVENQIIISEYDGTNPSVVFAGRFNPESVFAWPNWSKVVVLTSLGNPTGQENLYTVNLR